MPEQTTTTAINMPLHISYMYRAMTEKSLYFSIITSKTNQEQKNHEQKILLTKEKKMNIINKICTSIASMDARTRVSSNILSMTIHLHARCSYSNDEKRNDFVPPFCFFFCEIKKRKRRREHADHLSIDAESTNIFIFIIRV